MTFKEWGNLIQQNFEMHFYVSTIPVTGDSTLINKRGIYKDSVNATHPWTDFQLRPNFPIAMAVVSKSLNIFQCYPVFELLEMFPFCNNIEK